MSNVIRILETMGQDASQRHANAEELDCMLVAAQVDDRVRLAVAGNDPSLASLMDAPTIVCCGLLPNREDEDEEEEPSREDEEIRLLAAVEFVS